MHAPRSRSLAGLLLALALAPCALAAPAVAPTTVEQTLAGRGVPVDVYRPAGTPRGAVILSHGFTRSRTTLGGHAAAIAAAAGQSTRRKGGSGEISGSMVVGAGSGVAAGAEGAEQVAGHLAHLDLLGALGDAVAAMVAVDVCSNGVCRE
jgi:hypothetical protein